MAPSAAKTAAAANAFIRVTASILLCQVSLCPPDALCPRIFQLRTLYSSLHARGNPATPITTRTGRYWEPLPGFLLRASMGEVLGSISIPGSRECIATTAFKHGSSQRLNLFLTLSKTAAITLPASRAKGRQCVFFFALVRFARVVDTYHRCDNIKHVTILHSLSNNRVGICKPTKLERRTEVDSLQGK